ncbi:MAG: hypothetical protein HYZ25_04780 [Chloroflexi bacterium]|nr:hypothetical protein [Chloroflexota bacterium]
MKMKLLAALILAGIVLFGGFFLAHSNRNTETASAANLPDHFPTPTAYATALPGVSVQVMQKFAQGEILTQTAQGVEISAANFRIEKDNLKVDVCYQLPKGEDWLVGIAVAKIGDKEIVYDENPAIETSRTLENGKKQIMSSQTNPSSGVVEPVFAEMDSNDLPDYRCSTIVFRLEPDTIVSNVSVTIPNLTLAQKGSEGCNYIQTVQSVLDAEKTGIRLDCVTQDYGVFTSIAEKPASMSDEEAQQLVSEVRRKIFTVEGPWTFEWKFE